jgi:hypothetical protein
MKYLFMILLLTGCMSFSRDSGTIDTSTIKITCVDQCIVDLVRRVQLLELAVEQLQAKNFKADPNCYSGNGTPCQVVSVPQ